MVLGVTIGLTPRLGPMMRMNTFGSTTCSVLGVVFIVLILACGCGDEKAHTEPVPEVPLRDSPDHLLEWYAYAIEHEDIDMYEEALHDNFLFVFWLSVADSLGLPPSQPWWGKTAEVTAMREMFEDPTLKEIAFEFTDREDWIPVELEIEPGNFIYGDFTRTTPIMTLTIQEPGEEPKTLVADRFYLDFTVLQDPAFPGEDLWVILRIDQVLKNPGATPLYTTSSSM
jgi:hypothetical protein